MVIQVLAETHVPDILSTLSEALRYLSISIDSGDEYVRPSYVALKESILHLCDQLNLCKNHSNHDAERERLLLRARISASETFLLVVVCSSKEPSGGCAPTLALCMFGLDGNILTSRLRAKCALRVSDDTKMVADDLSTFLRRQGTRSQQQHREESEKLRDSSGGVNKLELVASGNLDSKIRKGKEVPFKLYR